MKARLLLAVCLCGAGVLLTPCQMMAAERSVMTEVTDSVYGIVDEVAHFKGGEAALTKYRIMHLDYPAAMRQQGRSGRVIVSFEVSRKGKVMNPKIVSSQDEGFNDEVLNFVLSMPKWVPAKLNGKKAASRIMMPIMFRLYE